MQEVAKCEVSYPPMANGPLAKPDGMRGALVAQLKRRAYPAALFAAASLGLGYYFLIHRQIKKIRIGLGGQKTADELFEDIKEYGVFRSVKASWQEE